MTAYNYIFNNTDDQALVERKEDFSGGENTRQHTSKILPNQGETIENWDIMVPGELRKTPGLTLAEDLGSPKSANMIMLGAFTKKSGLVELPSVLQALKRILSAKKKLIEINEKALNTGYNLF